jgi:hypothetical protein
MGLLAKFRERKELKALAQVESIRQRAEAEAAASARSAYDAWQRTRLDEPTTTVHGVVLKPGEQAYLVVQGAAFVEPKRAAGQWKGRSQGTSIHIAKGVTYRVGASRGTFQEGEERPTPTDVGTFVVTSARCLFVGTKRTTEWAYSKLVGYDTDGPGTAFFNVSNRQKTTGVMFGEAAETQTDAVIAAAIAKATSVDTYTQLVDAMEAEYLYRYALWQAVKDGQPVPERPPAPGVDGPDEPE